MMLAKEKRVELAKRYFDRLKTGEEVRAIAEDFGVTASYVPTIARKELAKQKEEAGANGLTQEILDERQRQAFAFLAERYGWNLQPAAKKLPPTPTTTTDPNSPPSRPPPTN